MTAITSPLAVNQLGIWFGHHAAPEASSAFHGILSGRIRSAVDLPALSRAYEAFVLRHDGARTTFHHGPDGPFQRVEARAPRSLEIVFAEDLTETALLARIRNESRKPFDLARGALRGLAYSRATDDVIVAFVAHHIGWDLLSTDLLLEELPRLYLEATGGPPADLPEPKASFTEFVRAEATFLASDEAETLARGWETLLAGAPPKSNLPLDHPRAPVREPRGASLVQTFSADVVDRLRPLGKSLLRTMLGAFAVTLWRYGGEHEIVIGTAADNRPSADWVGVTGNFVTMLPLRISLEPSMTVEALLTALHGVVRAASALRRFPFGRIVDRIRPPRDASITPLIQTAMGLHGLPKHPHLSALMIPGARWRADIGPWSCEAYALPQHEGQLDLELVCALEDGAMHAELKYHPDLFDRRTVERMAASLRAVVEAFAASATTTLADIDLVPRDDLPVLAALANRAAPMSTTLHALFDAAARRHPDRAAIVAGDIRLRYDEVEARSHRCAHALIARGVGPGKRVGIVAHRTPATITLMLAVMKTGAAYVPLAPDWPEERARAVSTDAQLEHVLDASDLDALLTTSADATAPAIEVSPADPLYVLYTSGSTGIPKGVVVPHRGVVNTTQWLREEFAITERDHVSQAVSLSFDGSVCELWTALTAGATLHLVDDETRLSPTAFARWLERSGVTVATLPTPLATALLREPAAPGSLRLLLVGGDVLHLPPSAPPYEVVNLYGPTEYSVNTTFARVHFDTGRAPPIGRPIANTSVYVLDGGRRVPIGAPGELWVGGAGLALGYLGRPDLTGERFVANPIEAEPATLYRTGDLVRVRPDGDLEFLGRVDQQVKVRGFRVEIGEVESALRQVDGVIDTCVLAEPSRLVAWVVPRAGVALSPTEIREALRRRMPEYMVPAVITTTTSIPRTSNGKLDRAALPPIHEERAQDRVPPTDDDEALLLSLWQRVLQTTELGVTDDFFHHGGDSLLALQLSLLVEQELGRTLPLLTNARRANVREQAKRLRESELPSEVHVLRPGAASAATTLLVHPLAPGEPYAALADTAPPTARVAAARWAGKRGASIETIAAAHAEAVGSMPLRALAGWSFGGLVAFELACRLARRTGVAPDVFLFDTLAPKTELPTSEAALTEWFLADAGEARSGEATRIALRAFRETIATFQAYTPSARYPGRVVLLRARERLGDWVAPSADGGWSAWTETLRIELIDGNHHSMMAAPHVSQLSTWLFEP